MGSEPLAALALTRKPRLWGLETRLPRSWPGQAVRSRQASEHGRGLRDLKASVWGTRGLSRDEPRPASRNPGPEAGPNEGGACWLRRRSARPPQPHVLGGRHVGRSLPEEKMRRTGRAGPARTARVPVTSLPHPQSRAEAAQPQPARPGAPRLRCPTPS